MRYIHLLFSLVFAWLGTPWLAVAQIKSVNIATVVDVASKSENISFAWDKTQDYDAITEQCRNLVRAFPGLVEMESIGESAKGKRIWALTISNFSTGNTHLKPGYLVEGNTLYNPGIGSDHALYLAWHLLQNYATDQQINKLLEHKVFYIIPITFPDAKVTSAAGSNKGYTTVLDDDHDGRMEEDGPDDLTNDGVITLMRRKSPTGYFSQDPDNPLKLIAASKRNQEKYDWLGFEGFDNDRDGLVNEDPVGYQSIDQDWSWQWKPVYGAHSSSSAYPFSIPENRALKDFINKHPNIAATQVHYAQTHALEMLLHQRGGDALHSESQDTKEQTREDRIWQSHKWKWFKYAKGLQAFPVEILATEQNSWVSQDGTSTDAIEKAIGSSNIYHAWTPFEHPSLGAIEIGGLQVHPAIHPEGDFLVKDLEKFARHTIFNAMQMPQLVIHKIERKLLNDGLWEVTATIHNTGLMPTHTAEDLANKLERADYVMLKDGVVLASSVVDSDFAKASTTALLTPNKVEVPNMPINSTLQIRWIVKPTNPLMLLEIDSRKGGVVSTRF